METRKIVNFFNSSENEYSKFTTKNGTLLKVNQKVLFHMKIQLKSSLESSLCDYSDAYVLVRGNVTVAGTENNTKIAFKNCSPFRKCRTEINETFIDKAEHINIAILMYNLIEYSDNYSDTSGSLWQFKRDEIEGHADLTVNGNHLQNNSSSFKHKSSLITHRDGVKIAVPLKYFSNFWRSLEMLLVIVRLKLHCHRIQIVF